MCWNVHFWKDRYCELNSEGVGRLLEEWKPTVIALQEVKADVSNPFSFQQKKKKDDKTELEKVCERLSLPSFMYLDVGGCGNALGTSLEVIGKHSFMLECKGENRGVVGMDIKLQSGKVLTIYNVHLDHRKEETRMEQLKSLLDYTRTKNPLHLLVGDFNALTRTDYSEEEWEELKESMPGKDRAGAIGPQSQVTDHLRQLGYVDCFAPNTQQTFWTRFLEQVVLRIDYVWLSPCLGPASSSLLTLRQVVDSEVSDHLPLFVEINLSLLPS